MRRFLLRLATLATIVTPFAAAPASASFTALYGLGDSLTDRGNIPLLLGAPVPVPPYVSGQFSNGPTWIETFAQRLGLGPTGPSLAPGGNVYAYGLGRADNAPPPGLLPPQSAAIINLPGQVNAFLASGQPTKGALFAVWAGNNDVLQTLAAAALLPDPAAQQALIAGAIATSLGSLLTQLQVLADAGAGNFLVFNLPDLGKTPRLNANPLTSAAGTAAAAAFNAGLAAGLAGFDAQPGIRVRDVDAFGLINDAVANPGAFGLTNATGACLVGGSINYVVPNPANLVCTPEQQQTFLFFDDLHPSATTHRIIAQAALNAVPAPGGLGLLLVAMAGLVLARRPAG
jgi:phospholipase/lecithinase/hemolysin